MQFLEPWGRARRHEFPSGRGFMACWTRLSPPSLGSERKNTCACRSWEV